MYCCWVFSCCRHAAVGAVARRTNVTPVRWRITKLPLGHQGQRIFVQPATPPMGTASNATPARAIVRRKPHHCAAGTPRIPQCVWTGSISHGKPQRIGPSRVSRDRVDRNGRDLVSSPNVRTTSLCGGSDRRSIRFPRGRVRIGPSQRIAMVRAGVRSRTRHDTCQTRPGIAPGGRGAVGICLVRLPGRNTRIAGRLRHHRSQEP